MPLPGRPPHPPCAGQLDSHDRFRPSTDNGPSLPQSSLLKRPRSPPRHVVCVGSFFRRDRDVCRIHRECSDCGGDGGVVVVEVMVGESGGGDGGGERGVASTATAGFT